MSLLVFTNVSICAFLHRCRSFNPSLCHLWPFLLFYVTVSRPCPMWEFPLTGPPIWHSYTTHLIWWLGEPWQAWGTSSQPSWLEIWRWNYQPCTWWIDSLESVWMVQVQYPMISENKSKYSQWENLRSNASMNHFTEFIQICSTGEGTHKPRGPTQLNPKGAVMLFAIFIKS